MRFRWAGSVRHSEEETRARLRHYFEQIGFYTVEETPDLSLQRGKQGWTLNPRQLWMRVDTKVRGWGMETLVDVTFELVPQRLLSESGAELLVSEVREMVRYLEHGSADFERLETLAKQAVREVHQFLWVALGISSGFAIGATLAVHALGWVSPLAPVVGGVAIGITMGYVYARFQRRHRR